MKPGILEEDEEEQFDEGDFNEVELIAHDCRELLLQDIDAEKRAIAGAHSFENKVMSMDNMMMHLFLEADGYPKLHRFLEAIWRRLEALQKMMGEEAGKELSLVREEDSRAIELSRGVQHHEWRAAWKKAGEALEQEEHGLRADFRLLRKVQRKLRDIKGLIERGEHAAVKDGKIVAVMHEGKKLDALEHLAGLFHALYRFIGFYENVFESMKNKEKGLIRRLQKQEREAESRQKP